MRRRTKGTWPRRPWSLADIRELRALYPDTETSALVRMLKRSIPAIYGMAGKLGLVKSAAYMASPAAYRFRRGTHPGLATQFRPGHVPANKGLRRPGWAPGRMAQTQFKKGDWPRNKDPEYYVLGALRINSDGYIDMRVSFDAGAKGWRALHRILWEDAHGPVPHGHIVVFRNRDKLDVELGNLELITYAENMRRNTVHNLPRPLKETIHALGQLKRRIREKQDRGSARPSV